MTSDPLSSPLATHVPRYRIDWLTLSGLGTVDNHGREWELTGEKGWNTRAAPRTTRDARATGHGSYRGVAWANDKTLSISGTVHFTDPAQRELTLLALRGLCSDPGRLYTLRRTAGPIDQTRQVELDGEPDVEPVGHFDIDFQLPFAAPDPRAHDHAWQEPVSAVPEAPAGGLDFTGPGLDFTSPGLNFGASPLPEIARVNNLGTAPAYPLFALVGPLSAPVIRDVVTGRDLAYRGDVDAGETVWINCDAYAQRDVPGHGRLSTTRGNVGALAPVITEWPVVDPGTEGAYALWATGGGGTAGLRTALRSAWW